MDTLIYQPLNNNKTPLQYTTTKGQQIPIEPKVKQIINFKEFLKAKPTDKNNKKLTDIISEQDLEQIYIINTLSNQAEQIINQIKKSPYSHMQILTGFKQFPDKDYQKLLGIIIPKKQLTDYNVQQELTKYLLSLKFIQEGKILDQSQPTKTTIGLFYNRKIT